MANHIEIQGHRGCRALRPENTIESFWHAIELGVDTLELDVVVSKDNQVIVSHDPYMSADIMCKPDGSGISVKEQESLNLYKMTATEIQGYRCGLIPHPQFPLQEQVEGYKPTLQELVLRIKEMCDQFGKTYPKWNVEIKSRPEWDGVFHPKIEIYAQIIANEMEYLDIGSELTLQSFDARIINLMRGLDPDLRFFFLSEEQKASILDYLEPITYKPYGFSPHHSLVTPKIVAQCKNVGVTLAVWTVNDRLIAEEMVEMGVTKIITDCPDVINSKYLNDFK